MRVLGLMSGTSVDGIDAALVRCVPTTGDPDGVLQLHVEHHAEFPWPDDLRNRLLGAVAPAKVGVAELCALDQLVGIEFARVVRESAAWGPCDLVASHGQTLHHAVGADGRVSGTLQIGEPAWIAATGIPVVSNLRAADIAAGGHGAPLAPLLDELWLGGRPTAALNLGGIANVSIVGRGPVLAGDTGPANCLLDEQALRLTGQRCDLDGRMAGQGRVRQDVLDALLSDAWFDLPLPRSTGRDLFNGSWLNTRLAGIGLCVADVPGPDLMATLVELTARSVTDQLPAVDRMVVSGGGTNNPVLMARLAALSGVPVLVSDDLGLPSSAKEAVLCALIGFLSVMGHPGTVGGPAGRQATGAARPSVLGTLTPPSASFDRHMSRPPHRVVITTV